MKHLIFISCFFLPAILCAQKMNGVDIDKLTSINYMEVVVSKTPFKSTYFAKADYGQGLKVGDHGFQDETGKDIEFKSEIHVLNWLSSYGWIYVKDWTDQNIYHLILYRPKE